MDSASTVMSESPIAHLPADLGRLAVALLSGGTGTATLLIPPAPNPASSSTATGLSTAQHPCQSPPRC